MTDPIVVSFTVAELRALVPGAWHLLATPLGVYPGDAKEARARVTGALKVLRAGTFGAGWKFLDLRQLAPYATRVILDTMTPEPRPPEATARKRRRRRKPSPTSRRVKAQRTAIRDSSPDAGASLGGPTGDRAAASESAQ